MGGDRMETNQIQENSVLLSLLGTLTRDSSSHVTLPSFFTLTAFKSHLNLPLWLTGPPSPPEGH